MNISTLDLLNVRIDLSDVLSWRAAQSPRLIQLFPTRGSERGGGSVCATSTEHSWLEGLDAPKTKRYASSSETEGSATFTVEDATGWRVGDLFHIQGDHAVWRVSSVEGGTLAAQRVTQASPGFVAPDSGVLVFDSRPIPEGSASGEDFFMQSHAESNFTQIFRGDVSLTGTAQAVSQAGMENTIATQLEYATDALIRRINAALVFGVKSRRSGSAPGTMGGLYYFGTQEGGVGRALSGAPALSPALINRAAQDVLDAGCIPDAIICGTGQAQVISTFMESQVRVGERSTLAGRFVDTFVTSAGGATLRVVVEPSIPDTDAWVCDTRGFALVPLAGRALHTEPASTPGVDGSRAILIGDYTAEFKNAKQALCRLSGLKASTEVLG